ncbi:MAG: MBL fold metallo-hydrolase [Planctomycetota bacterium]|nr:MBL fold metallo-hydrolase [Planctomycetota bacterium]
MKIHFLGANRQVTGSCYCLEAAGQRLLVDCGLYQERAFVHRNWEPLPIAASSIQAMVLTHVHIDHIGLLPRRVAEGLQAPIYMTQPSASLAEIMLRDSARIHEEDAAHKLKRHQRDNHQSPHDVRPLYTEEDVEQTLPLIQSVAYNQTTKLCDGVFEVSFREAGHILGSAMLEIKVHEKGQTKVVVFSGDIGQCDKPIIRDPAMIEKADYVVMESTYGDRNHASHGDCESSLARIINQTVMRGGNVVIPTFAVERSQELIYYLSRLVQSGSIPQVPVFLDSPMAVDVTRVFQQHRSCFDQDAWDMIIEGKSILDFPGMQLCRSRDESRQINAETEPAVIMSTSGMCTAGRIKFHLKRNIGDPNAAIVFVGYQAHGTLGRQISSGKSPVRIHGRHYDVQAEIVQLSGFSGHTDQAGLLDWIGNFSEGPEQVFLSHGDQEAADELAELIRTQLSLQVSIPEFQQVVTLG